MPLHDASDAVFELTPEQGRALAAEFGTPLYVVDETHFRARIRRWRHAFQAAYPGGEITFASKANSALGLLAIAHQEGCDIDVASEGELRAALAAGVPAAHCHLHGNNKSEAELAFAIEVGIGKIVADNFEEIALLARFLREGKTIPAIVIRLAPGVDPQTHAKISTGQSDTKFGFNLTDGAADEAVRQALAAGLPLVGFHCHVGSQLLNPEAQISGGELIAEFAVRVAREQGFVASYLNVGGGLGIRYTANDDPMAVEPYCEAIVAAVRRAIAGSPLESASLVLAQEPGRSLIGESGVTLYTVGVIKTVPVKDIGTRTYVAVDGGLSDNPRPVMYGSKYTVRAIPGDDRGQWDYPVDGPGAAHGMPLTKPVTVSGKHCETDRLFVDVALPSDLQVGDLLQVLGTGAYNASMASNYNRFARPAMVLIRPDGSFSLIQRRDAWDEMFVRESVPPDLQPA